MAGSTNPVLPADLSVAQVHYPQSVYSPLMSKLVLIVHLLFNAAGIQLH